jgi:hypothetical protein
MVLVALDTMEQVEGVYQDRLNQHIAVLARSIDQGYAAPVSFKLDLTNKGFRACCQDRPVSRVTLSVGILQCLKNYFRIAFSAARIFFEPEISKIARPEFYGKDIANQLCHWPLVEMADMRRAHLAEFCASAAFDFLTFHELGHIKNGHFAIDKPARELDAQALEVDADLFAASMHAHLFKNKSDFPDWLALVRYGPEYSAYALALFAYFSLMRLHMDDEWLLSDIESRPYPPHAVRRVITSAVFVNIATMKGIPDPDGFVFAMMWQAEASYLAMIGSHFPEIWPDIKSIREISDYGQVLIGRLKELEPLMVARSGLKRLHTLLPPNQL